MTAPGITSDDSASAPSAAVPVSPQAPDAKGPTPPPRIGTALRPTSMPSRPVSPDDGRGPITVGKPAESMPDEELLLDLADLFKVFSDTTRIKILFTLMGRELSVSDISDETDTTQSAVSHQLRTLKQAHLVKFERDGRNVLYSLADDHVYTMLNQGLNHICE